MRTDLEKLRTSGRISATALAHGRAMLEPGQKIAAVQEAVEAKIRELGGEPAFPAQVSRNHIAAHYCSPPGDPTEVQAGDIIKLDCTLVREVERNLLLGAQDRAAPARDAPTATVLLDRLVRSGQEQMASVVLDFAGGRRHGGPRRNIKPRPKLRAKKDTRRKAPRKTLAKKYGPFEEKPRRVEEGRL